MKQNSKKPRFLKTSGTAYSKLALFYQLLVLSYIFLTCASDKALSAENSDPELFGINKNYILLTTHSNYPIGKSLSFLRSGGYGFGLQYMHTLDADWVMSVGGQFKNFKDKETDRLRSLFSGYHETLAQVRIYYPAYLLVGIQTLYMLPSLSNTIPPKRDPNLDTEVGIGLCMYIFSKIGDDFSSYFKVSRWRGTKTTRLQGFEVGFGIGYSF